jgi:hypothetical protein
VRLKLAFVRGKPASILLTVVVSGEDPTDQWVVPFEVR